MSSSWPDQPARDTIATDLGATLFVEASAGSGKTTQLVARLLRLLLSGEARIDQVAAITFTEAAAAELRDRLAEALERAASDGTAAAADALAGLDAAAITTLHGFSRRILAEHPFSAGLPPVFEVLDQFRSLVDFNERWGEMLDRLLVGDEARSLQWALALHVRLDALKTIARAMDDHWDLAPAAGERSPLPPIDREGVLGPLRQAISLAERCGDPEDGLVDHLRGLESWADRLGDCANEIEVLGVLAGFDRKLTTTKGKLGAWDGHKGDVTELLGEAQGALEQLLARAGNAALHRLGVALAAQAHEAAAARQREGRLQFHDLLVLARDLVRDRPEVHRALHDQFRFLLIDEFQDTDPIQAELAVRIASADPDGGPWQSLTVEPGRLFFVGDPKQSIYRFRGADVGLFMEAKAALVEQSLQLTTNFRSVPGIVEWVDAVFGDLVGGDYRPSHPARAAGQVEPPVVILGTGPPTGSWEQEAADVAAAVLAARDERWPVGDERRPARLDDVTVLVPTRRVVPFLEDAFDQSGIPYRLESSSLVYSATEVQELLAILHAVDDPTDEPAVIAALRSPGFGCGDDDLLRHRLAGGDWDYRTTVPATGPVATGLEALRELHEARWWHEVSALVGMVVEERRLLPLSLDGPRWREAWRRLRYVLDQARQFTEASSGDLRRFLAWVDLQQADDARVTEVVLSEPDVDAVRVMTIHAAKGLEFPVVVLAGLGTQPRVPGPVVLFGPDGPELAVRKDLTTPGYPLLAEREEALDAGERVRLLYVAATRARDHLVVSVHRSERGMAARLADACAEHRDLWRPFEAESPPPAPSRTGAGGVAGAGGDRRSREEWLAARRQRLGPGALPRTLAATTVARLGRAAIDVDEAPERAAWRRGRAGTAVGRAVHATLQSVDLATGEGLAALATAQAVAEGVPGRAGDVERLVRSALDSEVVRAAVVGGRYWRELYVGAPVGNRVLEGFVDLLVEGADGLEVVDYKTDQVGDLDDHRLQGAAYAVAVEAAISRPVSRCTFLFLRPDGAVARHIVDLEAAMEEVHTLVAGG